MNILMATAELAPLAKTGGLGDVLGALPQALGRLGHSVHIVMPYYGTISAQTHGVPAKGDWFVTQQGGRQVFGGLHSWQPHENVTLHLVAQDPLFRRNGIYGDEHGGFGDNHLRYLFLSQATLEVAKRQAATEEPFDVFHGHDWHTGLVPVFLREGRAGVNIPSVFSIHNLQYQGRFGTDVLEQAGLGQGYFHPERLELYGSVSYMKAGLVYSDMLSTVSRAYAREIQTAEHGHGLEGLLRSRREDLVGIVNGIDTDLWNPSKDEHLPAHFREGQLAGKEICKMHLQRELGLPIRPEVPVLAIVSRLVDQKGIELIRQVLPRLMREDVQLVVLGSGERRYQTLFQEAQRTWNRQVGVRIGFDEGLAHRIEAGADMFLMPSLFEPCGLNQLYSLRYGTVPIVRAVGGLDDTVVDYDPVHGLGNGFKFETYDGNGLWWAISRALRTYHDRPHWQHLRDVIMLEDHSWEHAAHAYLELYARAILKHDA